MMALETISMYRTKEPAVATLYKPVGNQPETYILGILFTPILLVGVLGNSILILIIVRHPNMRSVTNMYLISLALGDLLFILTSTFTSIVYIFFEGWPFGLSSCRLWETAKDLSMGVSVFTLTALSAERYWAIINPIRHHTSSKQLTVVIVVALWLVATIIALPSTILSHLRKSQQQSEFKYCYPFSEDRRIRQGVVLFKFLTHYLIPLATIACFNLQIAKLLELTRRNMPGELQGPSAQMHARKKLARMVQLLVFMFMICFLPHHVYMLLFHLLSDGETNIKFTDLWEIFRNLAFCLSFINSCINPVALYFTSSAFRTYFNHYLCLWKCGNHNPHSNTTSSSAKVAFSSAAVISSSSTTLPSQISIATTTTSDN